EYQEPSAEISLAVLTSSCPWCQEGIHLVVLSQVMVRVIVLCPFLVRPGVCPPSPLVRLKDLSNHIQWMRLTHNSCSFLITLTVTGPGARRLGFQTSLEIR